MPLFTCRYVIYLYHTDIYIYYIYTWYVYIYTGELDPIFHRSPVFSFSGKRSPRLRLKAGRRGPWTGKFLNLNQGD